MEQKQTKMSFIWKHIEGEWYDRWETRFALKDDSCGFTIELVRPADTFGNWHLICKNLYLMDLSLSTTNLLIAQKRALSFISGVLENYVNRIKEELDESVRP